MNMCLHLVVELFSGSLASRPSETNMAPFMPFRVILVHNTWTNMIVKMTILRLLGLSDDKEKIGVARPEGPPLRWFR